MVTGDLALRRDSGPEGANKGSGCLEKKVGAFRLVARRKSTRRLRAEEKPYSELRMRAQGNNDPMTAVRRGR